MNGLAAGYNEGLTVFEACPAQKALEAGKKGISDMRITGNNDIF